jgi:hypothetical protein
MAPLAIVATALRRSNEHSISDRPRRLERRMRLPQRTGIDTEAWLPWQGTPPYRLWPEIDMRTIARKS